MSPTSEARLTAHLLPPPPLLPCGRRSNTHKAPSESDGGSTYAAEADGEEGSTEVPSHLCRDVSQDLEQVRSPLRAKTSPAARGRARPARSGCGGCLSWLWRLARHDELGHEFVRGSSSSRSCPTQLDTLEDIGLLGCGAFGTVTLVKCKLSDRTFALKAVPKGLVIQRHMQHAVLREKDLLERAECPFTVRLEKTMATPEHLFFLMEAALGGDLWTVYSRYSFCGSERHARFFIACVVRALEHLHSNEILYRDLKMENIVVDASGYAKLCDFGLAVCLSDRPGGKAFTICGTTGQMAPEVASGLGYSYGADWWCLGVLLFELMTGDSPFAAADEALILEKKARGIDTVEIPVGFYWPDLVRALCAHNLTARLPLLVGGVGNIIDHPWYSTVAFDWSAHAARMMAAEHVPEIDGPEDFRNFSAIWMDRPQSVS